jgi:hypothetical protein
MAVEVLIFFDGQREQSRRMDLARAATVAARRMEPETAWPEFFKDQNANAVPAAGADMSQFEWEHPTPESFQGDLDKVMAASASVKLRDGPDPVIPSPSPPQTAADLEWS